MKTVRRRVMRSAGASTVAGGPIWLPCHRAVCTRELGPLCLALLMSALPAHECSPSFLWVQCGFAITLLPASGVYEGSSNATVAPAALAVC